MTDTALPKITIYGELAYGTGDPGGQRKIYEDQIKSLLKKAEYLPLGKLSQRPQDLEQED